MLQYTNGPRDHGSIILPINSSLIFFHVFCLIDHQHPVFLLFFCDGMDHRSKNHTQWASYHHMTSKVLFLPLLLAKEMYSQEPLPVSWGGCEDSGNVLLPGVWQSAQGWPRHRAPHVVRSFADMGSCPQTAGPPIPVFSCPCPQGGGAGAAPAVPCPSLPLSGAVGQEGLWGTPQPVQCLGKGR